MLSKGGMDGFREQDSDGLENILQCNKLRNRRNRATFIYKDLKIMLVISTAKKRT